MLIGVDLVEIDRIKRLAADFDFLKRVYTDEELQLIENVSDHRRYEILAGRFAVKEAATKALGTGISKGVTFQDIQTAKGSNGEPVLSIKGKAKQIADSLGVIATRVSISHAAGLAVGYVLLEVDPKFNPK